MRDIVAEKIPWYIDYIENGGTYMTKQGKEGQCKYEFKFNNAFGEPVESFNYDPDEGSSSNLTLNLMKMALGYAGILMIQ